MVTRLVCEFSILWKMYEGGNRNRNFYLVWPKVQTAQIIFAQVSRIAIICLVCLSSLKLVVNVIAILGCPLG